MTHNNRRTHPRFLLPVECAWSGASGLSETRIGDLSLTGCYVDSSQVPATGETVQITVTLGESTVTLTGKVVHASIGMGFAMQFDALDERTERHLSAFLTPTLPVEGAA